MTDCLVAPVSVVGRSGRVGVASTLIPPVLRAAAGFSSRLLRGRGVAFACTTAGRLLSRDGFVTFVLRNGGLFLVPWRDQYWMRPLLLEREYEREIDEFLACALKPEDWFLDCGANAGLWSIAVSKVIDESERIVAVEAGSAAYSLLERNCRTNGNAFVSMKRALSDASAGDVAFFASSVDLASSSMMSALAPERALMERVATITFHELLEMSVGDDTGRLAVAKLDIEGMEERIVASLDADRHENLILLYEDHGRDVTSVTTRVLLERGFVVGFLSRMAPPQRIAVGDTGSLKLLKTDPLKGYNFVAVAPNGSAAERIMSLYPTLRG